MCLTPRQQLLLVQKVTGQLLPLTHGTGFMPGLVLIALLGQPGEGPGQGCCSSRVLRLGFPPATVCCCAPLGLCRWAFAGLMVAVMGQGVARQGIIWALPPAVVSLGSFVGVQMSFVT